MKRPLLLISIFWASFTYGQSLSSDAGSAASQTPGNRAWNNTGNATGAVNGTVSSAGTLNPGNPNTEQLLLTNFNFSALPASISITGISASVTRSSSTANAVSDLAIELIKGGVVQTAANRANGTNWPSALTAVTYGSNSDLWNNTWTRADMVASNFGIMVSGTRNGSNTTARVDAVTITVYYTITTPIMLSSFDLRLNNAGLPEVSFTTELEENVGEFNIQRSANGKQFSDLIAIKPRGSSGIQTRYTTIDEHPLHGRNYYRLKEVDRDGQQFLFNIKSIEIAGMSQSLRAYYSRGSLHITLASTPGRYQYRLFDISGREVFRGAFLTDTRNVDIQAPMPLLLNGIYILAVDGADGFHYTSKIYIQK